MDQAWLSDGEMEHLEELHRLDLENPLANQDDMPYEEYDQCLGILIATR